MHIVKTGTVLGAVVGAGLLWSSTIATAAPLGQGSGTAKAAAQLAERSLVIEVQRRGPRRGGGIGPGGAAALGILGGAIIGGIIASQPPPPPPPGVYAAPPGDYDDAVAYCMQRYRSYDPYSQTYLGFDGLRHPCP